MSEPNDQLRGLAESIRRVAEDGFNMLLESHRNDADRKELQRWVSARCGRGDCSQKDAAHYVLDLLATLPKGTSLCIK